MTTTFDSHYPHVDVTCPPWHDAACRHCGEPLEYHTTDDPDLAPTIGNAGCLDDAAASFWDRRPIRQFILADGDNLECDHATSCTICDAEMCSEHSDDYTTCADGISAHHDDCSSSCGECNGARAYDAAADRGDAIRKGEWF